MKKEEVRAYTKPVAVGMGRDGLGDKVGVALIGLGYSQRMGLWMRKRKKLGGVSSEFSPTEVKNTKEKAG